MHVSEGTNVRVFRVDDHLFRVDVDRPNAPAEALSDGRWRPVVLTVEEVAGLINARELTPEEVGELDLPD